MLLLVTDTSGRNGSVALARANEPGDQVQIIESVPLAGGTFSAQLVPQISALLSKHGFAKADIGAFVVVSGPGSFTGLRVGLAAIKGLAEILEKPIVPVSLLEVLAAAANHNGKVVAALDAGRGEVYAGEYEVEGESTLLIHEHLISRDDLVQTRNGSPIVTPDANISDAATTAGAPTVAINAISMDNIVRLGWRKLQAGHTVSPAQLDANYIRRTIAEIYPKPSS